VNETVLVTRASGVATVLLNRPQQLNSMNGDLLEGLLAAVEDVMADDEIHVIVLTGAGRGFCAGGDLQGMIDVEGPRSVDDEVTSLRRFAAVSSMLRSCPATTIAAVNGPCAGAGLSIAAATDLRIASDRAVFRTAFLSAGLSGDFGGTWLLNDLLGSSRARALLLLNEKIDALTALQIGLVSRVVPEAQLMQEVGDVARSLAASPPLARADIKANLNDAATLTFEEALVAESVRHVRNGHSKDAREAGLAFLERRQPTFQGR